MIPAALMRVEKARARIPACRYCATTRLQLRMDACSQVTSDSTFQRYRRQRLEDHCEHHHLLTLLLYFAAVLEPLRVSSGGESASDKVR
jgi:hypothetical protein